MTKLPLLFAAALFTASLTSASGSESTSPVGSWKTIDDENGHVKSIVQITEDNGELTGKVVRVLESDRGPHPVCTACTGDRKDKPIEGMTIMWGVHKSGNVWDGGTILDPKNGKTYRVKLALLDGGKKLDVHGYFGIALLGRTQTWLREK
jgi:uncharacterized protein (DUF2147 family)